MNNYVWCHGPKCHEQKTQDRIRGAKGSKVLRTRKIKQRGYEKSMFGHGGGNIWNYFCSHNCQMDFVHKHAEQIVRIEPRLEPLETPVEVREETQVRRWDGYKYTTKEIDYSAEV